MEKEKIKKLYKIKQDIVHDLISIDFKGLNSPTEACFKDGQGNTHKFYLSGSNAVLYFIYFRDNTNDNRVHESVKQSFIIHCIENNLKCVIKLVLLSDKKFNDSTVILNDNNTYYFKEKDITKECSNAEINSVIKMFQNQYKISDNNLLVFTKYNFTCLVTFNRGEWKIYILFIDEEINKIRDIVSSAFSSFLVKKYIVVFNSTNSEFCFCKCEN